MKVTFIDKTTIKTHLETTLLAVTAITVAVVTVMSIYTYSRGSVISSWVTRVGIDLVLTVRVSPRRGGAQYIPTFYVTSNKTDLFN